jgi:hypothetical protein
MINEFGLGHVGEFLAIYEQLKDRKDINFKYCFTGDILPQPVQEQLRGIFKENLILYKAIGRDLNYIKIGMGIPGNLFRNLPVLFRSRALFKQDPDLVCLNFCSLAHVLFRGPVRHTIQVWGGMGKYLDDGTLSKENILNRLILRSSLKSAGVNHAQLQCNLTGDRITDAPLSIGECPHYLSTPIMPQVEKEWTLPFDDFSLMYFTTAAPKSVPMEAIQVARENPKDNFIVFGGKPGEIHGVPSNIHFAGLVEPACFLYALRRANAFIGTLGLGPPKEAYQLNIPIYVLPLHAEQRANMRFCPDAVVLERLLDYTRKKGTWVPDANKSRQAGDSASFVADKIERYVANRRR